MKQPEFALERWQSHHENAVTFNLAESGVQPLTVAELRDVAGFDPGPTMLGYGHTDGSPTLRDRIATLYPEADPDHVVVTTGSAEANFLVLWRLVEPGDRVVVVRPTYEQTTGLASGLGADVRSLWLNEDRDWQPEPGSAGDAIGPGTRLVVVTNPNNPTGAVLDDRSVAEIVGAAERVGAWILSDEVYAGAELSGRSMRTLWGSYSRVIVSASLSKAYGLAGLRLGWLLAPAELREDLWARKDYTTIAPSPLSDCLAAAALVPPVRQRLLERSRGILHANLEQLERWTKTHAQVLSFRSPAAGAIAFLRYDLAIGSEDLARRLLEEASVLVVPGIHFGLEGFVRIGFGYTDPPLAAALDRVSGLLGSMTGTRRDLAC